MAQTRTMSAIEVITNTILGFILGLLANLLILPLFGYDVSIGESSIMAGVFTLLSFIRGYVVRRIFNKLN